MFEFPDSGWWRKGKVWISAVALATAVAGWFIYDDLMSPQWMRSFGLDMAARGTIVSTNSEETVFSTMRGRADPDSPFICFTRSASFPWGQVYFVPSGGVLPKALADLDWNGANVDELGRRMARDDRYQLIAFARDGQVIEYGYYFTMWADLSALARQEGFGREDAVFLADSDGKIYSLMAADPVPNSACR